MLGGSKVDVEELIPKYSRRVGGREIYSLRQRGTVGDYRQSFEALALPLENLPEAMLEGHFMNGLKPEIGAELRVLRPRCLEQMMDLAQRIEERNLVV